MVSFEGPVRRIAATARRLLPGVLIGFFLTLTLDLLSTSKWPGFFVVSFLAGAIFLMCFLDWAALSLLLAPFYRETGRPPAPLRVVLGAIGIGALAAGLGALFAPEMAEHLVPSNIDLRLLFVEATSWALVALLGVAVGIATHLALHRSFSPFPFWIFACGLFVFRFLADSSLRVVFAGRERFLEWGSVLSFILFLNGQTPRIGRVGKTALGAGFLALVAVLAFFLSLVGSRGETRSILFADYPGAASSVSLLQFLTDKDGDGFASGFGGSDCDDEDPEVSPAAVEIVGNGKDDNCIGGDLRDFVDTDAPPSSAVGPKRSVILITIDAWRSDMLAAEDDRGDPLMPNLAALSRTAAFFPRAYAQAPYTDLSMRSFLTGHLPVDFEVGGRFAGLEPTIAEILGGSGYATYCQQQVYLLSPFAFLGFAVVDDALAVENADFHGLTSGKTTDRALKAVAELMAGTAPFFFWVHYSDPHSDHMHVDSAPIADESPRGRYLQEVWYTDREIGRLLRALAAARFGERGLLFITGDHGELIGEGGEFSHATVLSEETLRVPLLVQGPEVPFGRFETRVRLVDLRSTILELAAGIRASSHGRSLAPIWSKAETADREVFAETRYGGISLRTILADGWQYIDDLKNGAAYLHRTDEPFGKRENLLAQRADRGAILKGRLGHVLDEAMNSVILQRKIAKLKERMLPTGARQKRDRMIDTLQCARGSREACQKLLISSDR